MTRVRSGSGARGVRFARVVVAAALALAAGAALAQSYPAKPVRLVVPFPPGGATDIIARLVAGKLQEQWTQPVVLDYKPGGGTVIGTDAVAKAAPDGYTLGMVITAHVINPSLRSDLPYDTQKDLAGVSMVAVSHIALVAAPNAPFATLAELIAHAKANPGKLAYATPGTGTAMHLAGELLKSTAGIDLVHVPYKGGSPAYADVMAGRVALQLDPMFASMANIRAGKVKPIAITSPRRAQSAPDIPAVAETLPGFEVMSVSGIVAPAATPREIVRRVGAELNRALASQDLVQGMAKVGMEPAPNTPEQFDAFIAAEIAKWSRIVKAAGIKAD
jgi:tripartite-type tricarboxylate transporter receptor subunit TctC